MVVHRGIVVVHGVGESGKGAYLGLFVEPLARLVCEALGDERVVIEAENAPDDAAISTAALALSDEQTGQPVERWEIREAWWSRTFSPSSAQSVLYWGIIGGLTVLWASFKHVFVRNLLRFIAPQRYERLPLARTDLRGRPLNPTTGRRAGEEVEGVWTVAGASRGKALVDAVVWFVVTAAYLAVAVAGLLIIVPVYLLLLTPLAALFPQVGTLQRRIVGALVRGVGDQQAMTTRPFALASAANEVARALQPMLDPRALAARHAREPEFTGYDTVTLVAYSGGAVVSFDALATRVRDWMQQPVAPTLRRPARVNWITAGSGLNLAFRMRRQKSSQDAAFWHRRLDGYVNWLNIYARYDPVPQGPAPEELVEALVGPDPWLAKKPNLAVVRPPYVCLRVVNDDFPATDHFGYWGNSDEVMSRVLHAITADRLATNRLDPQQLDFFPTKLAGLRETIARRTARGRAHRNEVLRRQLPIYAGMLAFVAVLPWAAGVGRWLLGSAGLLGAPPLSFRGRVLDDVVPTAIGGLNVEPYRDWLVGATAVAFAALIAVQLLQLVGSLVGWVRQGGSPWLVLVPTATTVLSLGLMVWALTVAA